MLNLQIDDIQYPLEMIAGFSQSYKEESNTSTHRAIDGTPYRQTTWTKLTTSIAGNSWIAPPSFSLDSGVSHIIKCACPIAISLNSRIITIPRQFRTDANHEPSAYAFVDGKIVDCTYTLNGSIATIEEKIGASYYILNYLPILTVLIDSPDASLDSSSSSYPWNITAIEV